MSNEPLTYKEFITKLEYLKDWHDILVEQEGITHPVTLHHKGLIQKLRAANYKHSVQHAKHIKEGYRLGFKKHTKENNYVGN